MEEKGIHRGTVTEMGERTGSEGEQVEAGRHWARKEGGTAHSRKHTVAVDIPLWTKLLMFFDKAA